MAKKYSCEIIPYELQFHKPATTSRSTMTSRKIWTLKIMDNFGRDGFGEIAPLEGLSAELNLNFEEKLKEVAGNIEHFLNNKPELLNYPSILFGIESAWLSYKHRDFIFYKTPFTQENKSIPINALVWMGDFDEMKTQIDAILEKDVSCLKLKIGGIDFEREIELLTHIRKFRNERTLTLRLDANGAFSAENALDKLKRLSSFQIHSIEQPIKPNQIEELASIIKDSPIPIALDEELIGKNTYKDKWSLLDRLNPHYIVLKPSLHGGILGSEEWIFIANQMKIDWWITSALESNLGLNTIAQWCSKYEKCYEMPQGLGTGQLFANNFPTNLVTENYKLSILK